MRTEFAQVNDYETAKQLMPWAAIIIKVENGYRGFESIDDYRTWINQM